MAIAPIYRDIFNYDKSATDKILAEQTKAEETSATPLPTAVTIEADLASVEIGGIINRDLPLEKVQLAIEDEPEADTPIDAETGNSLSKREQRRLKRQERRNKKKNANKPETITGGPVTEAPAEETPVNEPVSGIPTNDIAELDAGFNRMKYMRRVVALNNDQIAQDIADGKITGTATLGIGGRYSFSNLSTPTGYFESLPEQP
jgi:hypothetical protein